MIPSMTLNPTDRELLLGGQKSGKSRAAELRAAHWLATPGREAWLIATARAGDAEMAARIERHRVERARRVPGLRTLEEPIELARAIERSTGPGRLVVVDCLTLWLTQVAFPLEGAAPPAAEVERRCDELVAAVGRAAGALVLVSNEIGLGLIALDADTRRFVDALGRLHQRIAAACSRVTLLVAGCELPVKRSVA
jgi:adenosylcobinamide kinase/adenosylcobinamide-phosphate guanylyltransferase